MQQRNPHRRQVVSHHLRDRSQVHTLALRSHVALSNESLVVVVVRSGQKAGEACALGAWKLPQAAQQLVVKGVYGRLGRILLLRKRIGGGGDVLGSESKID